MVQFCQQKDNWNGCVGGRVDGSNTTKKTTWLAHFWLPDGCPLASADAPYCWQATGNAHGPKSSDELRIEDIFRGVVGFMVGWMVGPPWC